MPSPRDVASKATRESRAKGGKARAAKIRADKEQARELALGRAAGLVERALDQLETALDSDDDRIALQAARDVL
jgi:hypothetical protein